MAVFEFTETTKKVVLLLPAARETLVGLVENDGGCLTEGEEVIENAIVFMKPFRLVKVIVALLVSLFPSVISGRLLLIEKVGLGAAV